MRKIIILIMSLFVLTSTFAKEYPFEEVLFIEGVEGFGIGESVSFTNVGDGSRRIYIINGFFSPEKSSLFYDNARVKRLLIHCFDRDKNLVNVEERELNDTGEMQVLEFSERYKSFQFIIKEVYPGRKYEDTAITGIFCDALDLYEWELCPKISNVGAEVGIMTTADGFGTKAWENGKVVFYVDIKQKASYNASFAKDMTAEWKRELFYLF